MNAYLAGRNRMNKVLKEFATNWLKDNIVALPETNQHLFKQMYAKGKIDLDIWSVIEEMNEEKLDWAMQQIINTLAK